MDVRAGTARSFRDVAGCFATGVTVTTSVLAGVRVGMTVSSFTTVSLDPLLVLVCLRTGCRVVRAAAVSGRFAVTVLAADQNDVGRWFAASGRRHVEDEFAPIGWHPEPSTGCPVISDGAAYFGCAVQSVVPAGDHVVLIGQVLAYGPLRDTEALVFVRGAYTTALPAPERLGGSPR